MALGTTAAATPTAIHLSPGAVDCGQGGWAANASTTCRLAAAVAQAAPRNPRLNFIVMVRDPHSGGNRKFTCNEVGGYADCGSQDLEVHVVLQG